MENRKRERVYQNLRFLILFAPKKSIQISLSLLWCCSFMCSDRAGHYSCGGSDKESICRIAFTRLKQIMYKLLHLLSLCVYKQLKTCISQVIKVTRLCVNPTSCKVTDSVYSGSDDSFLSLAGHLVSAKIVKLILLLQIICPNQIAGHS